jgi:hypothetical protein
MEQGHQLVLPTRPYRAEKAAYIAIGDIMWLRQIDPGAHRTAIQGSNLSIKDMCGMDAEEP